MLESINNASTSVIQKTEAATPPPALSPKTPSESEVKTVTDQNLDKVKQTEKNLLEEDEKKEQAGQEEISQHMLDALEKGFESVHNVSLSFSKHDKSGRTMIMVTNKDTEELIREIPAEQLLDIAVKMEEMLGLLFDKTV